MKKMEPVVHALAPLGNLFLVVTVPELRREGMTYLSLYALQRAIEIADTSTTRHFTQEMLRTETGAPTYEASRACGFLTASELLEMGRDPQDKRVRVLIPTARGRRALHRIFSGAARRLWSGIPSEGQVRRMAEITEALLEVQRMLRGEFQLCFTDPIEDSLWQAREKSQVRRSIQQSRP
jgi:DNA-binding MarR family transcriptional regulator